MSRFRVTGGALLASAAILSLSVGGAWAQDDAFMTEAKAYIETVTAPVTEWTGPTTGPKAQPDKLVIYVSDDQRNGGAKGVGDGAEEAAKAIGWEFRLLDGQGAPVDPRLGADAGDRAAARRHHPRHDRRARAGAADRAGRRAGHQGRRLAFRRRARRRSKACPA